jgi:signal transduction histidine kinase
VSGFAVIPVRPPKRWRLRVSTFRTVRYAVLQILIAIACVFVLRQPPPEPPAGYALTEFSLNEHGATHAVTLPHFTAPRFSMNDPPVYTGQFAWSEADAREAWSVFLPRFTNGAEVAVNGVVLLDSRRDSAANRLDRATPEIVVIPASLLHDGTNGIAIRLFVWGPITGFLDRVYVGPDDALRPYYDLRTLIFVTMPVVLAAWQAILAVILSIMWIMRRHETANGVLAAAMALGTVQAFVPALVPGAVAAPPSGHHLSAVLIASAPIEAGLVLIFVLLFFGWKWSRAGWLIFLPGLIVAAVGLFGNRVQLREIFLFLGTPTVGLYLLLLALAVMQVAIRRQNFATVIFGCAVTIVLTCWIHDLLSVLEIVPDRRVFFSRLSYSSMLIAIGGALTWRFARALNQVDGFAGRLVVRVREAEEKLKESFAREQERARAAALARERSRLMRDLHDGLGGQLVSIVALSERGEAIAPIGEAARAALKDLRLVIDSMDDIGGDLMLALGSWRERAMAQLRPHHIALDWRTTSAEGLPVHPELRPWHVIQILRLLDEALTNAVKHAGAMRIQVSIATVMDDAGRPCGCITVEDDGKGFDLGEDGTAATRRGGRGLRNMKNRAAQCGAELELVSSAAGTRVRLKLPYRFPDGEASAV